MSLDSFNAWMAANPEWLGLAIFLIAFLECAAIVGIVLPGVVLLFGVAVIAGSVRSPTQTCRASRRRRVPWQSGQGWVLRNLASSSRTVTDSVSR